MWHCSLPFPLCFWLSDFLEENIRDQTSISTKTVCCWMETLRVLIKCELYWLCLRLFWSSTDFVLLPSEVPIFMFNSRNTLSRSIYNGALSCSTVFTFFEYLLFYKLKRKKKKNTTKKNRTNFCDPSTLPSSPLGKEFLHCSKKRFENSQK